MYKPQHNFSLNRQICSIHLPVESVRICLRLAILPFLLCTKVLFSFSYFESLFFHPQLMWNNTSYVLCLDTKRLVATLPHWKDVICRKSISLARRMMSTESPRHTPRGMCWLSCRRTLCKTLFFHETRRQRETHSRPTHSHAFHPPRTRLTRYVDTSYFDEKYAWDFSRFFSVCEGLRHVVPCS